MAGGVGEEVIGLKNSGRDGHLLCSALTTIDRAQMDDFALRHILANEDQFGFGQNNSVALGADCLGLSGCDAKVAS